jgi:hypothetical protein
MKIYFPLATLFIFILFVSGCASIPPEAPELSAELGKRISEIENSHITLLHKFFVQKRDEVDKFIINEWVPTFAEEFFSDQRISEAWNTIVSENDIQERLKFITILGPKLQLKINSKRLELIKPLDELERRIEIEIRDNYNQVKSMNNSITSFLVSASEVAENRNRYLGMIGITEDKIGEIINETDSIVNGLLQKAEGTESHIENTEDYLNKLKELINEI